MIIKEIRCKSCMAKSALADYVINPYAGCQHGCIYCYADFIRRFRNIHEKWGDFIYAKVNCPELLKKELKKNRPGSILLSSVTDPYQPVEAKFGLTREILQTIADSPCRSKFKVEILTKSALARRDFGIMKRLDAELGFSVNTLDEKAARKIEPFASPPRERVKALKEAKEKGIRVYGFISPVIPGLTNLDEIFRELSFCNYVWVELLNTYPSAMARLMPVIKSDFPAVAKGMEYLTGNRREYSNEVKNEVCGLKKKYGLKVSGIIPHI